VFSQSREPGLSDVLLESAPLPDAIRSIAVGGSGALDLLPTGTLMPMRADMLGSARMNEVLERLRDEYDAIILDSPPLNVVADAGLLGTTVDGVLLVARAGVTATEALMDAMEQLRNVRAPVLGAVLNDVDFKRDATYDRGYKHWGQANDAYYAAAVE
jgi:capsular exopolysaccharide synthesis family protein